MRKIFFTLLFSVVVSNVVSATPVMNTCYSTIRFVAVSETEPTKASAHMIVVENPWPSSTCNLSACNSFAYIDYADKQLYALVLGLILKGEGVSSPSPQVWLQIETEHPLKGASPAITGWGTSCKLITAGWRY